MKLVGMLDSPYVRRAAILGTLLGVKFEHESVSVFRHMERFRQISPLFKAPTLIADDGTVLVDSNIVLRHFEDLAARDTRPREPVARLHDLALEGTAIVVCDKAVGIEYERKRPEAQRHAPWTDRIVQQLHDALGILERDPVLDGPATTPGSVTAAVGWGFVRFVIPEYVAADAFPKVAAFAARAEASDAFSAWPIDRT